MCAEKKMRAAVRNIDSCTAACCRAVTHKLRLIQSSSAEHAKATFPSPHDQPRTRTSEPGLFFFFAVSHETCRHLKKSWIYAPNIKRRHQLRYFHLIARLALSSNFNFKVTALRRDPVCIQPTSTGFPRFIGLQHNPSVPFNTYIHVTPEG